MRTVRRAASRLLVLSVLGCGNGDSNDPGEPFPDAGGVYEMAGGFDDIGSEDGSFSGTLELNQASQESCALTGTIAILVDLAGDVFNITDNLGGATVSPDGVVTFTIGDAGASWTFTGTFTGLDIEQGRHTLTASEGTLSGSWQAGRTAEAVAGAVRRIAR